jgi:hypothetical protein
MDAARWPQVFRVRQQVVGPLVDDVAGEVEAGLAGLGLGGQVAAGDTVAIGAGSRGIVDVAEGVRAVAVHLTRLGAEPFVVPAMGSHGGGTAEGQRETLAARGITESTIGCPVRSSMRTVEVGRSALGFPLLLDAHAAAADHVVVVNRVKSHTMFTGEVESGLSKMVMLGLGKQAGAATYHGAIHDHGWMEVVRDVVPRLVADGHGGRGKVVAGVALVERGDDRTARVAVVAGDRFLADEPELLRAAREWMAKLPFADVDLLLVDRIGKDVSGAGLDVNVVGRKGSPHESHEDALARVRTIAVRGLTDATHGNALGIGLAELCRSRVLEQMDVAATRINALTAGDVPAAMAPLDYRTDAEMISVALGLIGLRRPADARVCWIRDTLRLDEALCSAVFLDEALRRDDLDVISDPFPLPLDGDGNLPDDLPSA